MRRPTLAQWHDKLLLFFDHFVLKLRVFSPFWTRPKHHFVYSNLYNTRIAQKTILSLDNKRIWFNRNINRSIEQARAISRSLAIENYYNAVSACHTEMLCSSWRWDDSGCRVLCIQCHSLHSIVGFDINRNVVRIARL
jgi:hypothetical protein